MNLRVLQMTDSALPIGGYTHSWGLESAISRGLVCDPESLEYWTGQWLRTSWGPLEGKLAASSYRAVTGNDFKDLAQLNQIADVMIMPPATRQASREMGEQLLALAATWVWCEERLPRVLAAIDDKHFRWHHSVVFGLLGAISAATLREVVTAYLHQATLGMISAGVRAVPLGHTNGQQILAYLQSDIEALTVLISASETETIGSGCPFYEVLCDEQTRLYARMFRS